MPESTVCGGLQHGRGPPQLSPSLRRAVSSGRHHLYQVGYAVPADTMLLEIQWLAVCVCGGGGGDGHGRERGAVGQSRRMLAAALGAERRILLNK
jgi:hypothetical protein